MTRKGVRKGKERETGSRNNKGKKGQERNTKKKERKKE